MGKYRYGTRVASHHDGAGAGAGAQVEVAHRGYCLVVGSSDGAKFFFLVG